MQSIQQNPTLAETSTADPQATRHQTTPSRLTAAKLPRGIIGLLLPLAVTLGIGYLVGLSRQLDVSPSVTTTTPTPVAKKDLRSIEPTHREPKLNVLYTGTYQGNEGLFMRENSVADTEEFFENPMAGTVVTDKIRTIIDFSEFTNRNELTSFDEFKKISTFEQGVYNSDRSKLYLDLTPETKDLHELTQIYEIDMATGDKKVVWAYTSTGDNGDELYPDFLGGGFLVELLADRYLITGIGGSRGGDALDLHATVLVSLETGTQMFLGPVGGFEIDTNAQTLTYRQLELGRRKCAPTVQCDPDGTIADYLPTGTITTISLPK